MDLKSRPCRVSRFRKIKTPKQSYLAENAVVGASEALPDTSERSETHDEDGDDALDRGRHRVVVLVVVVGLEDDVIR